MAHAWGAAEMPAGCRVNAARAWRPAGAAATSARQHLKRRSGDADEVGAVRLLRDGYGLPRETPDDLRGGEHVLARLHRGEGAAAGRALFAASRLRRSSANDADRLRKYLARFGLDWTSVSSA
jgi:hypothetical protein